VTAWNQPARNGSRGGDWCEAFAISENAIAISIGDVCGHGPAVYDEMLAISDAIRHGICDGHELAHVMAAANRVACELRDAMPATAILAVLHTPSNRLWMVNAGHPPPLLQTASGATFLRRSPGDFPLGLFPEYAAAVDEVSVASGNLLVFYTDGIVERERDLIKGERQLIWAVANVYRFPYLNAAHAIAHEMHGGLTQLEDDAAVLTLRTT
jgi:serine phosphatase RsbU (regulator of sigma subunit)